jgi:hypothetical protein
MNVPSAYDSRASKRAMSLSRDSDLRLTGRVAPFSRPYPLTPKIIVGLVYGDGKMSPPPIFQSYSPWRLVKDQCRCAGNVRVRGRGSEMANPAKSHNPISLNSEVGRQFHEDSLSDLGSGREFRIQLRRS